jgi:hypothetical protein
MFVLFLNLVESFLCTCSVPKAAAVLVGWEGVLAWESRSGRTVLRNVDRLKGWRLEYLFRLREEMNWIHGNKANKSHIGLGLCVWEFE